MTMTMTIIIMKIIIIIMIINQLISIMEYMCWFLVLMWQTWELFFILYRFINCAKVQCIVYACICWHFTQASFVRSDIMVSRHENPFSIPILLWGNTTNYWLIPLTKSQLCGIFMFLLLSWTSSWTKSWVSGDMRCLDTWYNCNGHEYTIHYSDVTWGSPVDSLTHSASIVANISMSWSHHVTVDIIMTR